MITFLAYPNFNEAMEVLDPSRLGNQVYREALTLIRGGWPNHPASRMWRGHEHALAQYALAGLEVLAGRGRFYPRWVRYYNECLRRFPDTGNPLWLGREDVHASHRAILLYKDWDWYSQFGWSEQPAGPDQSGRWPYVWPV